MRGQTQQGLKIEEGLYALDLMIIEKKSKTQKMEKKGKKGRELGQCLGLREGESQLRSGRRKSNCDGWGGPWVPCPTGTGARLSTKGQKEKTGDLRNIAQHRSAKKFLEPYCYKEGTSK